MGHGSLYLIFALLLPVVAHLQDKLKYCCIQNNKADLNHFKLQFDGTISNVPPRKTFLKVKTKEKGSSPALSSVFYCRNFKKNHKGVLQNVIDMI